MIRLNFGPPPSPSNADQILKAWEPIDEPAPDQFVKKAAMLSYPLLLLVFGMWSATISLEAFFKELNFAMLLIFPALIVVHELVHLFAVPSKALKHGVLGLMTKPLVFYAIHVGPYRRNVYLRVLLAPLFVITVLPIMLHLVGISAHPAIVVASLINAMLSSGDVYGAYLIARQTTSNDTVQNIGWKTYRAPDLPIATAT